MPIFYGGFNNVSLAGPGGMRFTNDESQFSSLTGGRVEKAPGNPYKDNFIVFYRSDGAIMKVGIRAGGSATVKFKGAWNDKILGAWLPAGFRFDARKDRGSSNGAPMGYSMNFAGPGLHWNMQGSTGWGISGGYGYNRQKQWLDAHPEVGREQELKELESKASSIEREALIRKRIAEAEAQKEAALTQIIPVQEAAADRALQAEIQQTEREIKKDVATAQATMQGQQQIQQRQQELFAPPGYMPPGQAKKMSWGMISGIGGGAVALGLLIVLATRK